MPENDSLTSNRRAALKALAAATGAAGLAALPTRWGKPALRVGAMPAHAQASCYAVLIGEITLTGNGAWTGFIPVASLEVLPNGPFGWSCNGTGCIPVRVDNGGVGAGTVSFDLSFVGVFFDSIVLNEGESIYIGFNYDTMTGYADSVLVNVENAVNCTFS